MQRWKKALLAGLAAALLCGVLTLALLQNAAKREYPMESAAGIAMGTVVSMKLYDKTEPQLQKQVLSGIRALEKTISWREADSPVAQFNRTGRCKNDTVAQTVRVCLDLFRQTDGLFDPTIGSVSRLWDFGGEAQRLPAKAEIEAALQTVDAAKLHVDGAVLSGESGQQLDLGAVGKGLACDEAAAFLKQAGICGAVVSVGGSICAFGSRNKAGDPWRIAIRHPRKENAFLGTLLLREGFVSTSGDYEKYFEQGGKRYCHLLNAKTGYPAESGLCSVTVVCENGLLSDALSTACYLLGEEQSKALLAAYGASAVFVSDEGEISTFGDLEFTAYES